MAFVATSSIAGPSDAQVIEFARLSAASAHRAFLQSPPSDGVSISQRAFSEGKFVVYEYVLAIKSGTPENLLQAWRASVRSEIYPAACSEMKGNEFFDSGLSFRYRYVNRDGAPLDEFVVNKPGCRGIN
jgi:hypothetical protein